jgi:hypothetical protein
MPWPAPKFISQRSTRSIDRGKNDDVFSNFAPVSVKYPTAVWSGLRTSNDFFGSPEQEAFPFDPSATKR